MTSTCSWTAWLPNTHEDYWAEYGDQVNDLVTWYDKAPLTWAVPTYVAENEGITSIADLKGKADTFGGEIVGIESGAGLTRISKDSVIPTYELGDELLSWSSPPRRRCSVRSSAPSTTRSRSS